VYAIQDFPFTGVGLGTFRRVVGLLYPLFTISPDIDIAHAHNIFLQVALDVGVPGLIAYLALLWVAGAVAWHVARGGPPLLQALAIGLLAALVSLHLYGLTDALALGSKPGLAFWMILGLLAALPRVVDTELQNRFPHA
jgi:putative inorganic carbon (HCO3(-)) transporter